MEREAPEIVLEKERSLKRQNDFRLAEEYIAADFARIPEVLRVVLFRSVAIPLERETPRFRKLRRLGDVLHERQDVDLAVVLSDLSCLRSLQKARGNAVLRLFRETEIGVAHH